jgi:hypothetical protein
VAMMERTQETENKDKANNECEKIKKLMVFYRAQELSEEQVCCVNLHLLFCQECRWHLV